MKDTLDFSFSGVKTALLHMAQNKGIYPPESVTSSDDASGQTSAEDRKKLVQELAAAFQESVVDVMTAKLLSMADKYHAKGLILAGGVAANGHLRQEVARRSSLPVIIPPPILCTDNGAMIAACAYYQHQRGEQFGLELDIDPGLPLG